MNITLILFRCKISKQCIRLIVVITITFFYSCVGYYRLQIDPSGRAYTRIFDFELEKATYREIQEKLGETKAIVDGSHADWQKRVHYFISKENLYISFSSGVLGGENVNCFIMSLSAPGEYFSTNTTNSLGEKDVNGIRLGISEADFFRRFYEDNIIEEGDDEYHQWLLPYENIKRFVTFENKIPIPMPIPLPMDMKQRREILRIHRGDLVYNDELISIWPIFVNGRLVELQVCKVTTY